jgi:hypothetical protein
VKIDENGRVHDAHGKFLPSESEIAAAEQTIVDAEVIETSEAVEKHATAEVAVRDSFAEWEIRLEELRHEDEAIKAELKRQEDMGKIVAWHERTAALLADRDPNVDHVARLAAHVEELERIENWSEPANHAAGFTVPAGKVAASFAGAIDRVRERRPVAVTSGTPRIDQLLGQS